MSRAFIRTGDGTGGVFSAVQLLMVGMMVLGLGWVESTVAQHPSTSPATTTGGPSETARESRPKADAKNTPKLLWVRCKYNGSAKDKLVESEKLTVEEYKKRGGQVVELKNADLNQWREGAGKDYAKANKYLQYVAYGKSIGADAVGGLDVFEITPDMVENFEGKKEGAYLHSWGISLSGCVSNFMLNLEEGAIETRAIPMSLAEGDAWAIPKSIDPRSCESAGLMDMMTAISKGRPFLGVGLNERTVSQVFANSPAEKAGLVVGDLLISLDDKEIKDIADLAEAMSQKKPGDEARIEFEREGKRSKKTAVVVDKAELEARNSPDGKPLPQLVGKDIEGREVRLADLKGKVVLLDFWATWCGPCVEEMPLVQLTWENLKDKGLVWVGVSGDQDESAWRDFVRDNRIGGIQLRDESWVSAMFVNGFPTIFLVDRGGLVSCRVRGGAIAQTAATLLRD